MGQYRRDFSTAGSGTITVNGATVNGTSRGVASFNLTNSDHLMIINELGEVCRAGRWAHTIFIRFTAGNDTFTVNGGTVAGTGGNPFIS